MITFRPPPGFTASPAHYAIAERMDAGASVIIEACAGAGKTKTLEVLLQHHLRRRPTVSALVCAFSKAIANDWSRRLAGLPVSVSTLHAMAWGAAGRPKLDPGCGVTAIRSAYATVRASGIVARADIDIVLALMKYALSAWDWYRGSAPDAQWWQEEAAPAVADRIPGPALVVAHRAMEEWIRCTGVVPDLDLCFVIPAVQARPPRAQYDVIAVDEAQDLSLMQIAYLQHLLAPGGQIVAIGDPDQAIYAWRGASKAAFTQIRERFQIGYTGRLNVSMRASQAVAAAARAFVPDYQARDQAPPGSFAQRARTEARQTWQELGSARGTAMVIGRTLLDPLRITTWWNRRGGRPMRLVLGSTAAPLRRLAGEIDQAAHDLRSRSRSPSEAVRAALVARKNLAHAVEDFETVDLCDALRLVHDDDPMKTLTAVVDGLLARETTRAGSGVIPDPAIQAMTAHAAKGLEADLVVVINPGGFNHARTPRAQRAQERNLRYVAATRAKLDLVYQDL